MSASTMRRIFASVLLLGMLGMGLQGCRWVTRGNLDDVGLVMRYMQNNPDGSLSFDAFPYQGGTAVIDRAGAIFWIMDPQAYVVNDAAKKAAPHLPVAPAKIGEEGILEAWDEVEE
jgi:hypothetical protein